MSNSREQGHPIPTSQSSTSARSFSRGYSTYDYYKENREAGHSHVASIVGAVVGTTATVSTQYVAARLGVRSMRSIPTAALGLPLAGYAFKKADRIGEATSAAVAYMADNAEVQYAPNGEPVLAMRERKESKDERKLPEEKPIPHPGQMSMPRTSSTSFVSQPFSAPHSEESEREVMRRAAMMPSAPRTSITPTTSDSNEIKISHFFDHFGVKLDPTLVRHHEAKLGPAVSAIVNLPFEQFNLNTRRYLAVFHKELDNLVNVGHEINLPEAVYVGTAAKLGISIINNVAEVAGFIPATSSALGFLGPIGAVGIAGVALYKLTSSFFSRSDNQAEFRRAIIGIHEHLAELDKINHQRYLALQSGIDHLDRLGRANLQLSHHIATEVHSIKEMIYKKFRFSIEFREGVYTRLGYIGDMVRRTQSYLELQGERDRKTNFNKRVHLIETLLPYVPEETLMYHLAILNFGLVGMEFSQYSGALDYLAQGRSAAMAAEFLCNHGAIKSLGYLAEVFEAILPETPLETVGIDKTKLVPMDWLSNVKKQQEFLENYSMPVRAKEILKKVQPQIIKIASNTLCFMEHVGQNATLFSNLLMLRNNLLDEIYIAIQQAWLTKKREIAAEEKTFDPEENLMRVRDIVGTHSQFIDLLNRLDQNTKLLQCFAEIGSLADEEQLELSRLMMSDHILNQRLNVCPSLTDVSSSRQMPLESKLEHVKIADEYTQHWEEGGHQDTFKITFSPVLPIAARTALSIQFSRQQDDRDEPVRAIYELKDAYYNSRELSISRSSLTRGDSLLEMTIQRNEAGLPNFFAVRLSKWLNEQRAPSIEIIHLQNLYGTPGRPTISKVYLPSGFSVENIAIAKVTPETKLNELSFTFVGMQGTRHVLGAMTINPYLAEEAMQRTARMVTKIIPSHHSGSAFFQAVKVRNWIIVGRLRDLSSMTLSMNSPDRNGKSQCELFGLNQGKWYELPPGPTLDYTRGFEHGPQYSQTIKMTPDKKEDGINFVVKSASATALMHYSIQPAIQFDSICERGINVLPTGTYIPRNPLAIQLSELIDSHRIGEMLAMEEQRLSRSTEVLHSEQKIEAVGQRSSLSSTPATTSRSLSSTTVSTPPVSLSSVSSTTFSHSSSSSSSSSSSAIVSVPRREGKSSQYRS